MYHIFCWLAKKKHVTTLIFKPTYDQKPDTIIKNRVHIWYNRENSQLTDFAHNR